MHSAAAGPTGTAIRKPITPPSMASVSGLKMKPETLIAGSQAFRREGPGRRDQPILCRHQLELALAHCRGLFEHGIDRRRGLAERRSDVAARQPVRSEESGNRVARAVGRDRKAN